MWAPQAGVSPDCATEEPRDVGGGGSIASSSVNFNFGKYLKRRVGAGVQGALKSIQEDPKQELDEEMLMKGGNNKNLTTSICCSPFFWSVLAKDRITFKYDVEVIHT